MSIQALNAVISHQFGSSAHKAVMVILADRADESWSCYPGQERIAAEMELSVRTVQRALTELESSGIIRRERRDSGGRRTSDRYYLNREKIESLPATVTGSQPDTMTGRVPEPTRHPVAYLPDTVSGEPSVREPSVKNNIPSHSLGVCEMAEVLPFKASPLDGFDDFWKAYPRKGPKDVARKAWPKAVAKAKGSKMLVEAAKRMAAWPHLPDKTHIPHPATWLNQERWLDDLTETYPPRAGRRADPREVERLLGEMEASRGR